MQAPSNGNIRRYLLLPHRPALAHGAPKRRNPLRGSTSVFGAQVQTWRQPCTLTFVAFALRAADRLLSECALAYVRKEKRKPLRAFDLS